MNKYILSFLYDFPTEKTEETKKSKQKKFSKKSKQEKQVKDPGPIIKGYLSKTAPFDFNIFVFNPDDDDEKRFYIRKLFSRFQKLDYIKKYKEGEIVEKTETGHNYITDEQYASIRIHNILLSIQQLNHFTYSQCHSEEEVFLILQYGTMLIQVASFEVNLEFQQIYRQYLQREDDTEEFYNFHLDLYEEIFVFTDFVQKNRLGIAQCLKNYGGKIINKLNSIDSKFSNEIGDCNKVFGLNEYNSINSKIEESIKNQIKTSNFSTNLNEFLKYLSQLDFCVTLHYFIANDDFLYVFTKEYTDFEDLMDPLLTLYKFDYDLFANSPTYFRLFFYFFQSKIYEKKNDKSDKKNEANKETNKLRHIFNSFQFTIQELYNHLFFGGYSEYSHPLKYKLDFKDKKKYDEKLDSTSSLFSYSKAAHMFSFSPIGIYSDNKQKSADGKSVKSIQYAFYPIAETALNLLSNQLNSWCIHVSEACNDELSIDLPDVLLEYIRHWTAHEYLLYQQCGIKVKEATRMAIQQQNVALSSIIETTQTSNNEPKQPPNNEEQASPVTEQPKKYKKKKQIQTNNMHSVSTQPNLSKVEIGNEDEKTSNSGITDNNNGGEESQTEELSKTYRVIYHYVSFLTSIIHKNITNLDYKKSANSFYIFKKYDIDDTNEPLANNQDDEKINEGIHPFLNFCQLYKLAQILGPAGIKFISKNVTHDFNLSVKGLIEMLSLIKKTKKRSGNEKKTTDWQNNKIAEYLAEIGNLSYLRELLKFVTQTYIRNYHPTLYMDLYIEIAKRNAIALLQKFDTNDKENANASLEKSDTNNQENANAGLKKTDTNDQGIKSYDKLIDLFDMEEDCKLTENLFEYLTGEKENEKEKKKEKDYSNLSTALENVDLIQNAFESIYFTFRGGYQISNLAIARGIDEFFSLLYYYYYLTENKIINNEAETPLSMHGIKEIHEKLIGYIQSNELEKDSKRSLFAKVYFHNSSYFHQNFTIYNNINYNENNKKNENNENNENNKKNENNENNKKNENKYNYAGRKRKRGTPNDSLLIDTIEWIDIVKNMMKSEEKPKSSTTATKS